MAEQFIADLWAAHKYYESAEPFIVGHTFLLQISFKVVTNKFNSRTNWRTCSYFQILLSICGGH